MKNIIRPAALLLYLLTFCTFFLMGMLFAAVSGSTQNKGMDSEALLIFYGLGSAAVPLLASVIFAVGTDISLLKKINKVMLIVLAVASVITFTMLT